MAIFLAETSRVIVQGMTGSEGTKHTRADAGLRRRRSSAASPRARLARASTWTAPRSRSSATVADGHGATGADVSVVFVPPRFAPGGRRWRPSTRRSRSWSSSPRASRCTTPREFFQYAAARDTTRLIGPNCPGIISPGKSNAGIIPADHHQAPDASGSCRKSGTLTYQMMYELRDLGFSTCVGIGGDPVIGTTHIDCLQAFQDDPETDAIVMIGEIGGDAEERAAAYIERARDQAGRRLRRRVHRPRGQDHGPRRRHRVGVVRHGRRQAGGPRGRRRPRRQDAERDGAADARDRHRVAVMHSA